MDLFSFIITFNDELGLWLNIWKALKLQLNLHFALIKFKDYMTSMKSLNSLNIKMVSSSLEAPNIEMLIIKIADISDLKRGIKEKVFQFINEKNRNSFIVFLMDIENNDSSVKSALKLFEKIKVELKNNDLKLLPTVISHPKVSDIISEFFKDLKTKISLEINTKIFFFYNQIELIKSRKFENKDFTYNYIVNKENLINYLQITEFWEEIYKINDEDLFNNYDHLEIIGKYCEPLCLTEFNETCIKKNILERNLKNIDYQQYIIFQILRSCKFIRDFKRLNNTLIRILTDIHKLKIYFLSECHFYFWVYIYCLKIIPFLKSLKNNFHHAFDEEINSNGQVYIYNQAKKFLNSLAIIIKTNIPNIKQFYSTISESFKIDNSENHNNNPLIEERDDNLVNFIKEIKEGEFEEKYIIIIENKIKLFEDYLNILNILEELISLKNNPKLVIKMQLDKIPILLKLNCLDQIKIILQKCLKVLKKDRWEYINNFYAFIFIILLTYLKNSEENINLIIEYLSFKYENIKSISSIMSFKSDNFVFDFISNFLNSNDFKKNNLNIRNVNLDITKILDLSINQLDEDNDQLDKFPNNNCNFSNNKISLLKSESKTLQIKFKNISKLNLMVDCIKLFFEDGISKEKIMFDTKIEKFLLESGEMMKNFLFEGKIFFKDMKLKLNNILIRLTCGIEGLYNMDSQNFIINIKSSQLNFHYLFSNQKNNQNFYTNTLYYSYFIFHNIGNEISGISLSFNDLENHEETLKILNDYELFELKDFNNAIELINGIKQGEIKSLPKGKEKVIIENNNVNIFSNQNIWSYILKLPVIFFDNSIKLNRVKKFSLSLSTSFDNENYNVNIKDEFLLNLISLFEIQNIMKMKWEKILIQSNVKLNSEFENAQIILDNDETYNLEFSKTINIVKFINNLNLDIFKKEPFFKYQISNNFYDYYLSKKDLQTKLLYFLDLNYLINIYPFAEKSYNDGFQIFSELKLIVEVNKLFSKDSFLIIKINESLNWNIVGKSKIMEKLQEKGKVKFTFNIIPLADGYVKLPEIIINEHEIKISQNNSSQDYLKLSNFLFEGNQKIIKIYPINNFQMKLNN